MRVPYATCSGVTLMKGLAGASVLAEQDTHLGKTFRSNLIIQMG